MICCGPLDDRYKTEKIEASLVRLEWAQNVGRLARVCICLCICFVFF